MKAKTVEQFIILKFLEENLEIQLFEIDLLDRKNVLVTDREGAQMIFTYEDRKITYRDLEEWLNGK